MEEEKTYFIDLEDGILLIDSSGAYLDKEVEFRIEEAAESDEPVFFTFRLCSNPGVNTDERLLKASKLIEEYLTEKWTQGEIKVDQFYE